MSTKQNRLPAEITTGHLTVHSRRRMAQRGIPLAAMNLVYQYGTRSWTRDGAFSFALDQAGRRRAAHEADVDDWRQHRDRLNIYVVVSVDGRVMTVANRTTRRHR